MVASDWLMGAWQDFPGTSFTVEGVGKSIPAGNYYLFDSNATLSLLGQFQAKIREEVADAVVTLTRSGKVTIYSPGATVIDIVFGADTTFRDGLGISSDISSSDFVGQNHSRYLWRSGRTSSPGKGSLGSTGALTTDRVYRESPALVTSTGHNTWYENRLSFGFVLNARFETKSRLNGEYTTFWADVISRAYRFKHYREITEDGTDADATLVGPEVLGPYVIRPPRNGSQFPYERDAGFKTQDVAHPVELDVRTVVELS